MGPNMLFTYDKTSKKISFPTETNFKSHHVLERRDIETWVENYPDILGEELLILSTEYNKFDKTNERLDLLALDRKGKLTIIELKRDDSGKKHELQAIKYASYCSNLTLDDITKIYLDYQTKKGNNLNEEMSKKQIVSFINENEEFQELDGKPRIILVAKEFQQEVTSTVLWLRNFAVNISCVKLSPYEVNPNIIAFESNVIIPLPDAKDFIISLEKKEQAVTKTLSQEEYNKFFLEIISKINDVLPRSSYRMPSGSYYYQIPVNINGIHLEFSFHGKPRSSFGVELHFEKSSKESNEHALKYFEKMIPELEQKLGEKVITQKDWGTRWSRMYVEKNEGKMTEELKLWAVEKMAMLYKLLKPELEKFKKEHNI